MKQGEFDLRSARPTVNHHRPVVGKTEGQLTGDRHDFLCQPAFSGDLQEA